MSKPTNWKQIKEMANNMNANQLNQAFEIEIDSLSIQDGINYVYLAGSKSKNGEVTLLAE